jgi:hypothetical protein
MLVAEIQMRPLRRACFPGPQPGARLQHHVRMGSRPGDLAAAVSAADWARVISASAGPAVLAGCRSALRRSAAPGSWPAPGA